LQQNNKKRNSRELKDVGGDDEKDDEAVRRESQVWGKRWTRRTAAGHLFKQEVEEEMERLIQTSGHTHMSAYQPALTNVWNGLLEEDQVRCEVEAKQWNTGAWPRERQIEYVLYYGKWWIPNLTNDFAERPKLNFTKLSQVSSVIYIAKWGFM
jgi:hypothetical protein